MEALVKLLEGAEDATVAKGALGAISSLVQGNPTNKLAVREANGIEVTINQLQPRDTSGAVRILDVGKANLLNCLMLIFEERVHTDDVPCKLAASAGMISSLDPARSHCV